jgi:26S proteasome regulatory subunit N3
MFVGSEIGKTLLSKLPTEQPDSVEMDVEPSPAAKPQKSYEKLPEAEVYLRLLIIHFFLATPSTQKQSLELAHETVSKIQAWNRRSMEPLAARVYIALGRAYEVVPGVEPSRIRNLLLAAQRTASLRRDDDTLAAVINLLLRNYLHYNLYSQADKLVAKVPFPETAGNSQLARYLYYVGRIRAVQLSYTEAHGHLQQAIRRAPAPTTAPGFYQAAHKIFVIVELLMGDIPERSLFRHPVLKKALYGYFEIVKGIQFTVNCGSWV